MITGILIAKTWPDGIDATLTVVYLALIIGLPLLGYVFMFLDFRRYLRSLRRAMVLVAQATPFTPYWALKERPPCLEALDLWPSCSEEDVLSAYRERVKSLHPDSGGDMQKFLKLQQHFEQALHLVRGQEGQRGS
ncbi:MAG: hypothetical protein GXP26_16070 [Planctomycetes bacterium]|nr:hypothetical protein [Planctomycetota bacterium]